MKGEVAVTGGTEEVGGARGRQEVQERQGCRKEAGGRRDKGLM